MDIYKVADCTLFTCVYLNDLWHSQILPNFCVNNVISFTEGARLDRNVVRVDAEEVHQDLGVALQGDIVQAGEEEVIVAEEV